MAVFLLVAEIILILALLVWLGIILNEEGAGKSGIGACIFILGLAIIIHTCFNWRTMPKAFLAWETVKEKVTTQQVIVEKNYPTTGPSVVETKWESTERWNKGSSVGRYQLRRLSNNAIFTVDFCSVPPPDFKVGSVIDISHTLVLKDNQPCSRLMEAKIISEPGAKK